MERHDTAAEELEALDVSLSRLKRLLAKWAAVAAVLFILAALVAKGVGGCL